MSNRERLAQTVQGMTEEEAAFYLAWLIKIMRDMEEVRDDAFCLALNERYLANPDKGEGVPIEEVAARLGVGDVRVIFKNEEGKIVVREIDNRGDIYK